MAKKSNVFGNTDPEVLKIELANVVDYLQALDLKKVSDVIDWKPTARGGVMPSIISTQEKIMTTAVSVIKQSAQFIMAVYEAEGLTETLNNQIDITVNKLKELQEFYFGQALIDIIDRKLEVEIGYTKSGEPKIMRFITASKEDQIKARGVINDNVAKIIPMIDTIRSYKTVTARGGIEIGEAMERFLKRKGEQED